MWQLKDIQQDWTLFLDRDGVINIEKKDDYIYNKEEFIFYDTALKALSILRKHFKYIIITTNQKGIGKGLMTDADLAGVHEYMLGEITKTGGGIDAIYYCAALDNNDPNRKPQPGMAFQAKKDYPAIDFSKSIIVGNNISDMQFGRNAGMHTVFVKTTDPENEAHETIDYAFNSLFEFAEAVVHTK